jgi:hypothetical protein
MLLGWPCRFLRLSVFEDEIFPCAHGMLENQREAPRRIYSEQVLLPAGLLRGARTEWPDPQPKKTEPREAAVLAPTNPPAAPASTPKRRKKAL